MGGGLHDVFSCQRCNKLSISHCTKFCELKKNFFVVLYNQRHRKKGAAKRLPTILTYMYFIQREIDRVRTVFFFGTASKSGQKMPRLGGVQKKLTSAAKRAKMELSRNQITTKGKQGSLCTPRIAQWKEKSNPRGCPRKSPRNSP